MANRGRRDAEWAEARRRCRLSDEDVRKAKELGLNPRKLIKNIPSPSQRWKAPVDVWVREQYRKRLGKAEPPPVDDDEAEDMESFDESQDDWAEPRSLEEEAEETDERMLRQQRNLRRAADYLAHRLASLDVVQRVVLFGSVAAPLAKEVPRFKELRRAGVAVWHECRDLDLAVWLTDCGSLKALQKAQGRALNDLLSDWDAGVAHHQVDMHLFEPGSDRYLGRLCHYGTCPKGKPECRVPRCGEALFLRQLEGYAFDETALAPGRAVTLFDRAQGTFPPAPEPDDIPF